MIRERSRVDTVRTRSRIRPTRKVRARPVYDPYLRVFQQLFQHQTRGALARAFLRHALGDARFCAHLDFDDKGLGVLGSAFGPDVIARLRKLSGLRQLLERALVIPGVRRRLETGDDPVDHKGADRIDSAIQIERGDQSLNGVRQESLLGAPAAKRTC